jgi:hypothetical protein
MRSRDQGPRSWPSCPERPRPETPETPGEDRRADRGTGHRGRSSGRPLRNVNPRPVRARSGTARRPWPFDPPTCGNDPSRTVLVPRQNGQNTKTSSANEVLGPPPRASSCPPGA